MTKYYCEDCKTEFTELVKQCCPECGSTKIWIISNDKARFAEECNDYYRTPDNE